MGRLLEKEYTIISDILKNPARSYEFMLGGTKIEDSMRKYNDYTSLYTPILREVDGAVDCTANIDYVF